MASSNGTGKRVPPSYEETMEELARRERGQNPKHDPTSPGQGVYRKRTDDDEVGHDDAGTNSEYQSAIVYTKRADDDEVGYDDEGTTSEYQSAIVYTKRTDDDEVGYDNAGTTSEYQSAIVYTKRTDDDEVGYDDEGTTSEYQSAIVYTKRTDDDEVGYDDAGTTSEYQSAKPATISHTTVQPKYLQPETTLLPQSPTSPSTEPSKGSPKKNRFKKSTSRSTSRSTSSSKRDPNTYAYENQQSVDYWASVEPVTIDPNIEPILMRPMVTRVGPDGRTYLRDTSIVVVQHDEHETRNTQKVIGKPTRPDNYLWYSFVGMAFCFFFGIFSLMRSREVPAKFDAGDYEGARKASSSARNWATIALIIGAVIIIVFIFLLFVSPCPLTRALQFKGVCPEGV
eukprot:XP_003729979.1 PREDICTED: uncharacterized protein LOC581836 isoform X1 [Strongylocentrotus purpuratus]